MKSFTTGFCTIFILFCACQGTQLFQKDLDNWVEGGNSEWIFNNGEIIGIADSTEGYLMTLTNYRDFELQLEFNPDSSINSGIFIRCKEQVLSPTECFEINIWDLHPNQDFRTGSIVTRTKPINRVETINRWNSYKIRIMGEHLQVWINDILTADLIDSSLPEGYIAIQASGNGKVRFRKIRIKEIG